MAQENLIAIAKALTMATNISEKEILEWEKQLANDLAVANRELEAIQPTFRIEDITEETIGKKNLFLKNEKLRLSHIKNNNRDYRLFSLKSLAWRDKNGWPTIVATNIASREFKISSEYMRGVNVHDSRTATTCSILISNSASYYDDMKNKVLALTEIRQLNTKIHFQFRGIIPKKTRGKILVALKSDRFENMFIISEPTEIIVNQIVYPCPGREHALVGDDGLYVWHIDTFKTTEVEKTTYSVPWSSEAQR